MYRNLEEGLGYIFQNRKLLENALTHSSYANENRERGLPDNERLEFLGDSILGFVVADYLYRRFPEKPEGELTRIRADLVCETNLAKAAETIHLGDFLLLGHGEDHGGGRKRDSIVSDAMESVIAASYMDGGFEAAKGIIDRLILSDIPVGRPRNFDYKTALQELVQRKKDQLLHYELIGESGPDHDKHFTVEVLLNGSSVGQGSGSSKKRAEQAAAEADAVASSTVKAGVFSSLLMALIYLAVTVVGAQSRGLFATSENGGIALAQIARHYLGSAGLVILAATVTLACLKTSVGLITSCAETFCGMFPKGPGYRAWAVLFTLISFALSNFGLSTIISYSVPVLMFLYPLAIALVLLALFGRFYRHDRAVYISVIVCTLLAALYDLICALPEGLYDALHADAVQAFGLRVLPFAGAGLGWICPLALGFVIGLAVHLMQKFRTK